jgi:hypothetical protein
MVRCGFLFEVRTEVLNIICNSFGFKGLMMNLPERGLNLRSAALYPRYSSIDAGIL